MAVVGSSSLQPLKGTNFENWYEICLLLSQQEGVNCDFSFESCKGKMELVSGQVYRNAHHNLQTSQKDQPL